MVMWGYTRDMDLEKIQDPNIVDNFKATDGGKFSTLW